MKIEVNRVTQEGLKLSEGLNPSVLDIESDIIKLGGQVEIEAEASRITNTVTVNLIINFTINTSCSRCLKELVMDCKKSFTLSHAVSRPNDVIDLDPYIREEIILDFPIKPLCSDSCKGLCLICGKNLNEGGCTCATT